MYVPYRCCVKSFEDYYNQQAGNGLSFYQGSQQQQGHGLGGFFRSLFRAAVPLLKSGAKAVGKQVLRSGVDLAQDALQGKNLKDSATQRLKEAGSVLTDKAGAKIKTMLGGGRRRRRKGLKKKRKTLKRIIRSKARKVYTSDIFSR
jgi:hypothetical protein